MKSLSGTPISPGYADGFAVVYGAQREVQVPCYAIDTQAVPEEQRRFAGAVDCASSDLMHFRDRVQMEYGEAESEIFATHLALINDPYFIGNVRERIARQGINAEQAIEDELGGAISKLESAESEFFRERGQDIRDVGNRLQRQLSPDGKDPLLALSPRSIIVARELLPSDSLDLDRSHVAAIITERGGATSHAAILARAMGIPAVTGVTGATAQIPSGARLLVNGETGEISIEPSVPQSDFFFGRKRHYDGSIALAVAAEDRECVTADGVRVRLLGNIGRPGETADVLQHHLLGVGLFRTEFLFMDDAEPPSFERQLGAYRAAAEAMGGGPLVIRTLDLGGDKTPVFLSPHFEANPNLGLRGLRLALTSLRDLFLVQLRAIVAAAQDRDVRVLFPMVFGGSDLRQAIELLHAAMAHEGRTRPLPVGAMIETPSALFVLDQILDQVDFLSIGTNDLTQFMLAADRNQVELSSGDGVLNPSVLRAIGHIAKEAQARGKPVCVCGEAAGDPAIAALLVGLGLRELSMSPVRAARVRYALRNIRQQDMAALAEQALSSESAEAVQDLLRRADRL